MRNLRLPFQGKTESAFFWRCKRASSSFSLRILHSKSRLLASAPRRLTVPKMNSATSSSTNRIRTNARTDKTAINMSSFIYAFRPLASKLRQHLQPPAIGFTLLFPQHSEGVHHDHEMPAKGLLKARADPFGGLLAHKGRGVFWPRLFGRRATADLQD